jgi:hypothetical protein
LEPQLGWNHFGASQFASVRNTQEMIMRNYAIAPAAAALCAYSAPAFSRPAKVQSLQTAVDPYNEGRSVSSGFGSECKELSKACIQEQLDEELDEQGGSKCGLYRQTLRSKVGS